ncbi:2,3-bisphosphoglycerate-dependent phosphoglycerate mutase [Aquamicrobium terrae]
MQPESSDSRTLVLLRHGESEGNARNVFTGWIDLGLTAKGKDEARAVGRSFRRRGLAFPHIFVSALDRTRETARLLAGGLEHTPDDFHVSAALNERDYGELAGLNKDEARQRWGDEQVRLWRRSYVTAPPGGESLRDVVARAAPYYLRSILPLVLRGEPCLVVSHGNVLRALTMAIEGFGPNEIEKIEYAPAEAIVYHLHADSTIASRERVPPPVIDGTAR